MPPGTPEQFVHPSCKNIHPTRKKREREKRETKHNRAVLECFDSYHLGVYESILTRKLVIFKKVQFLVIFDDFMMFLNAFFCVFCNFFNRKKQPFCTFGVLQICGCVKIIFSSVSGVSKQKKLVRFQQFHTKNHLLC